MSLEHSFVSIFDLHTSQLPIMKAEPSSPSLSDCGDTFGGVQQFSEEARQQQAYNLYKRDVGQSLQRDSRMENEFFGCRQLSISDFDGTRTIVTPTPSPINLAYLADDEESPTPSIARFPARTFPPRVNNDDYLADDETTPTQSAFTGPPQLMNVFYFRQNLRSPSSRSYSPDSPLYSEEGFLFHRFFNTPELQQRRLDAIQPRSSPRSPTPTPWNRNSSFNSPYNANFEPRESFSTDSEQEQTMDSIESDSIYDDEQSIASDNIYNGQADSKEVYIIGSRFDIDSIRDIGFVNSSVEFRADLTERAHVPSQYGRISNISTPELTQDDDVDDLDSVNEVQLGYDASPGTLHFYSQAGVPITTRELQDDFVAAQSTNLAGGILDIDQAAENEKHCANADFFDVDFPLKTTASSQELLASRAYGSVHIHSPKIKQESVDPDEQHLIPGIVDDLADPDYYLGPDVPAPDDSIFDKVYQARHGSGQILQDSTKPRLFPVVRIGQVKNSSLIKRRANRDVNGEGGAPQQLLPKTTFGQVPKFNVIPFTNNLSPLHSTYNDDLDPVRISKTPNYGKSFLVKKRPARESFDLIELCHENARREHSHKKPRLMSTPPPDSARLPSTPASTMSSIFTGSPMATALQGFTGQFELHVPERLARQKKATTKHVFGNHLHANGEIINLQYTTDPHHATKDLSDCPGLSITIEHASLHHSFAEEMPRNSEEEDLRREAHRECAAARLEGVSVGYYRYFAGHMTVEEYVEARMCVCWEGCLCNKLCTHFGDLVCPCADNLVVGEGA